jgi:hypothetical protein
MDKSSTELPLAARAPATDRLEDDEPSSVATVCVLGAVRFAVPALQAGTSVPRPSDRDGLSETETIF